MSLPPCPGPDPEHWRRPPPHVWDRRLLHWRQTPLHVRRRLFLRFSSAFGCLVLLAFGGMAVLAFLLTRAFQSGRHTALLVWIGSIALLWALGFALVTIGRRVSRDLAAPLADVMAAADSVASGDLSVRVPERGPADFIRLARSFNHMAEELQRADQQRRNLTADVAHELRTPLQIIQGNLEGVLDGVYEPTPEHLGVTLEETRLLARLVDDLRTLSLAEAGQLPLQLEPVNVAEVLTDVSTSFSGQTEIAGIMLEVQVSSPSPLTITADAGRLEQVLGNLLANALRYTPSGGTITLRAEGGNGCVLILVRDTGAGIPAEDLPYVFDRFWRGDRSRSRAGGAGSGLGLAIARQLVQAQGGRIWVESEVGRGTVFTIEFAQLTSTS